MNYYAFISGLPELTFNEQKKVYATHEFKEEVSKILSWKDKKVIHKLYLKYDNDNLLSYLKNDEEIISFNEQANYAPEIIRNLVEVVKNEDKKWNNKYPKYLQTFIHDFLNYEKIPREFWEDHIATLYFDYLLKKTYNRFLKQWCELNMNVRNILTTFSARRASIEYDFLIVGHNQVAAFLRTLQHPAGVSEFIDYYEQVRELDEISDLLQKEEEIDAFFWTWIEDYTFFHYFDVEKIMGYLFKLQIIERWKKLDPHRGNETFRNIVNNLKSSARQHNKNETNNR